jgi:hypothetical protein
MNERSERLRAHQRNIDRYQNLMKTKLSAIELRFVEQRLSEERFTLAMLQFMGSRGSASDIGLPDALQ